MVSSDVSAVKGPGLLRYIGYCYGLILPAGYDDWVRRDLAGPGAQRRTFVRVTIPALLVVAPLWLIPASTGMHLAMSTLLMVPFVYFAHALDKIWRAHRLRQHGLDPALVDEKDRARNEQIREEYQRRYGHATD